MTKQVVSDLNLSQKLLLRLGSFAHQTSDMMACEATIDVIGQEKTMWSIPGNMIYAENEAEVFLSSTDANDVGLKFKINGLNQQRKPVTGFSISNGHAQSIILDSTFTNSVPMLRINTVELQGTTSDLIPGVHNGLLYFAESDTTVAGVPITQSKIKIIAKPRHSVVSAGFFTVPADHIMQLEDMVMQPAANKPIDVILRNTTFKHNVPVTRVLEMSSRITQAISLPQYFEHTPFFEGDDVEFRFNSLDNNAQAIMCVSYVLIHKDSQLRFPKDSFGIFS